MSKEQSNRELALFELRRSLKAIGTIWILMNAVTLIVLMVGAFYYQVTLNGWYVTALVCTIFQILTLPSMAWHSWKHVKSIYLSGTSDY